VHASIDDVKWLAVPVLGVCALAAVLALRGARGANELRAYLAASFRARPDCPVPEPFVETNVAIDCFDGRLGSGRAIALVLGSEPGSRAVVWSYIGVYLVAGADVGDAWLAPWQARVRARGDWWGRRAGGPATTHILVGPPDTEPVRADRTADGGVFIAWRLVTLPTRARIEARLHEIEESLR
jgi:hypothetical protein